MLAKCKKGVVNYFKENILTLMLNVENEKKSMNYIYNDIIDISDMCIYIYNKYFWLEI